MSEALQYIREKRRRWAEDDDEWAHELGHERSPWNPEGEDNNGKP